MSGWEAQENPAHGRAFDFLVAGAGFPFAAAPLSWSWRLCRCYASGRLRLNLLPRRFKSAAVSQIKKAHPLKKDGPF